MYFIITSSKTVKNFKAKFLHIIRYIKFCNLQEYIFGVGINEADREIRTRDSSFSLLAGYLECYTTIVPLLS